MIKQRERYWKTDDIYAAAYLFSRNCIIVGIEADGSRAVFSFVDSLELTGWLAELKSGRPTVDVRMYICALRILRAKALDTLMHSHEEDR
jgi:hypothetical protein